MRIHRPPDESSSPRPRRRRHRGRLRIGLLRALGLGLLAGQPSTAARAETARGSPGRPRHSDSNVKRRKDQSDGGFRC
jgi:hypothetical protein